MDFDTRRQEAARDAVAPDGSDARILLGPRLRTPGASRPYMCVWADGCA